MRKFLKKNNLPCPRFSICRNVYETINFWRMLNEIKMIIKPLDSNSSRGVFVVNSEDEIEDKYEKAVIYSKEEK